MRIRGALVLSVSVHGAVLAVGSRLTAGRLVPPPAPDAAIVVTIEPPPLDVALVDRPAATLTPSGEAAPAANPARARLVAGAHATAETRAAGPGGETAAPDPHSADGSAALHLKMRGPDLALPATVVDRLAASGEPRDAPNASGRIHQHGREFAVPDRPGLGDDRDGQVPATVSQDGTMTFHDKPAVDPHWRIHVPSRKEIGDKLAAWYADPYASQRAGRPQDRAQYEQAVEGGWDTSGTNTDGAAALSFDERGYSRSGQPEIPVIGGALDPTAWAMRKMHIDPYASRKRKLLAETFDERADIGAQHAADDLARSSELIERNLERLWASKLSAADRRAALFELWDECAEGDDARGLAGARARALVIAFIRSHAPAGSSAGFTAAEIAAFDRRRSSREHFAPYMH